jgi:hypothetical protein
MVCSFVVGIERLVLLNAASAGDEVVDKDNDSDDEKKVNERSADV